MKANIRDFVRLEISHLPQNRKLNLSGFDYIYHVFEQIVCIETGEDKLDGLREQLVGSLEKIACTPIERKDINILFPSVWGNYEAFIRRIVYLLDRNKYDELKRDNCTIDPFLDYLEIQSRERDEEKRTTEIECFHQALKLRNNDSHDCPKMSVRECYENLAYSIAAMYLATEKAYPKLYNEKKRLAARYKIDLEKYLVQRITSPSLVEFGTKLPFFRLSDYCQGIKEIIKKGNSWSEHYFFNENGKLVKEISVNLDKENNESKEEYIYFYTKIGNEEKRLCHNNNRKFVDRIYKFDNCGVLVSIEKYSHISNNTILSNRIVIDYLANGEIEIKTEKVNNPLFSKRLHFNELGLLTYIFNFGLYVSYAYDQNGILERIEQGDGTRTEIQTIMGYLQFFNSENDKKTLEKTWEIKEGKILRITQYTDEGKPTYSQTFTYYQ